MYVCKVEHYMITSPVKSVKEKIMYEIAFSNILKSDTACDR